MFRPFRPFQSLVTGYNSAPSTLNVVRNFHASSEALVKQKYLKKIRRVHKHFASQMMKPKPAFVDPVLGRPGVGFLERIKARVSEPYTQIDILDAQNSANLLYGAEQAALQKAPREAREAILSEESHKRGVIERIISMENSSPYQSKKLAVNFAVKDFARFEGDTGSSEVQAAVWTIRINFLANHLKENKQDLKGLRQLQQLVHNRQGILKYLKRKDPERYFWTIEKLGLSDAAVTEEFHMSRKYFLQTQFFGDKTLPLKRTKKDTREQRKLETMRKKARKFLAQQKK
ncbi:mitochondrial 37S ribosomal protein MRPS28 [Sugiyamaella lignohabitans]|uniref:Mitochondrial 37S ribosomal protein MRPS28 n=1 Tax=Sugiyamaella lignohabitans TaxID=796027 RepID=A0A161HMD5_9ASCO|nr:mitochondrial 37S ribosomal protein MRPS28 [Sugiyamaella lignohabitans]ANB14837.1 mitochondrial 37S ribosomal protein MRPS28 [Sugiyamaella lignohabitans]